MAAAGLGNTPVDIGAAEIDPLPGVVLDILWELMESSGNAATMLVSDRDNFIPNLFMSACGDYITNSALQEDSAKFMAAYGRYGTPKGSGLERSFEHAEFVDLSCALISEAILPKVRSEMIERQESFSGATLLAFRRGKKLFLDSEEDQDNAPFGSYRSNVPAAIAASLGQKDKVMIASLWIVVMDIVELFAVHVVGSNDFDPTTITLKEWTEHVLRVQHLSGVMPCVYRCVPPFIEEWIEKPKDQRMDAEMHRLLQRRQMSEAVALYSEGQDKVDAKVLNGFLETITSTQWFSMRAAVKAISERLKEDAHVVTGLIEHLNNYQQNSESATQLLDSRVAEWADYYREHTGGELPTGPWSVEHYKAVDPLETIGSPAAHPNAATAATATPDSQSEEAEDEQRPAASPPATQRPAASQPTTQRPAATQPATIAPPAVAGPGPTPPPMPVNAGTMQKLTAPAPTPGQADVIPPPPPPPPNRAPQSSAARGANQETEIEGRQAPGGEASQPSGGPVRPTASDLVAGAGKLKKVSTSASTPTPPENSTPIGEVDANTAIAKKFANANPTSDDEDEEAAADQAEWDDDGGDDEAAAAVKAASEEAVAKQTKKRAARRWQSAAAGIKNQASAAAEAARAEAEKNALNPEKTQELAERAARLSSFLMPFVPETFAMADDAPAKKAAMDAAKIIQDIKTAAEQDMTNDAIAESKHQLREAAGLVLGLPNPDRQSKLQARAEEIETRVGALDLTSLAADKQEAFEKLKREAAFYRSIQLETNAFYDKANDQLDGFEDSVRGLSGYRDTGDMTPDRCYRDVLGDGDSSSSEGEEGSSASSSGGGGGEGSDDSGSGSTNSGGSANTQMETGGSGGSPSPSASEEKAQALLKMSQKMKDAAQAVIDENDALRKKNPNLAFLRNSEIMKLGFLVRKANNHTKAITKAAQENTTLSMDDLEDIEDDLGVSARELKEFDPYQRALANQA